VVSIRSGSFVLAAAGLLDGRNATTYWSHTQEFAERYPSVAVQPDVLFVQDGQVLTSSGYAAGRPPTTAPPSAASRRPDAGSAAPAGQSPHFR
jgi:putative intracellular protease/amidase